MHALWFGLSLGFKALFNTARYAHIPCMQHKTALPLVHCWSFCHLLGEVELLFFFLMLILYYPQTGN